MKTIISILTEENKQAKIKAAGEIINKGGIVAFPTETVYGLGANALDGDAVKKIFLAKGRPQDNPLIVHVADFDISPYVKNIPPLALKLMKKFWPGPLTIIFNKTDLIPAVTSANLSTIGIRMPANEIALELIKTAKTPIAAPSANLSGRPSPTDIYHCINDLDGKVDCIIGGEISNVGLESTIIDCTREPACVLRPGGINLEQLWEIDANIYLDPTILTKPTSDLKPIAPGMKYRHYAPLAPMKLVSRGVETVSYINHLTKESQALGLRVGIIATDETRDLYLADYVISFGSRNDLVVVAQNMYDSLRKMDEANVDIIYAETFVETGLGIAIMNRLKKASSYNIIEHEKNSVYLK